MRDLRRATVIRVAFVFALVGASSEPGKAQDQTELDDAEPNDAEPLLDSLFELRVTSGVAGHFVDPICEGDVTLRPSEFAYYAPNLATGSSGLSIDTGGLVSLHGVVEFVAMRDPSRLAEVVAELGYDALAFGEQDLGANRETVLAVLRSLGDRGVPIVASNLRCQDAATQLCELLQGGVTAELGGEMVAVINLLSDETLERIRPENADGITIQPLSEALEELVPHARSRGATVVVAIIDQGQGAHAAARTLELVDRLEAEAKPDIVLSAGAGDHVLFARPPTFQPALVAAASGRVVEVSVRRNSATRSLDILARPAPRSSEPASVVSILSEGDGEAYCEHWGRRLPGGELEREMSVDDLAQLTAEVMRETAHAEVAVLNRGAFDARWKPVREGYLSESDVHIAIQYDEPLVSAMVPARWLGRLALRLEGRDPLIGLGLSLTRSETTNAVRVKVNGNELDARGRYRVVTLRFLAAGGDDVFEEDDSIEWEPVPGSTLRSMMLEYLDEPRDVDPREAVADPFDTPLWTFDLAVDGTFSSSSVENSAGYAESQLQRDETVTVGLAAAIRADAFARLWAWDNQLNLDFRVQRTGDDSGFSEAMDLLAYRTNLRWRGFRSARAKIYVPEPFVENYLETEFTVPEESEQRHLLWRSTAGLQFVANWWISLKLHGGLEAEPLRDRYAPGVGAQFEIKPWPVWSSGLRHLDIESTIDYFASDLADVNRQVLRAAFAASIALNQWLSLGGAVDFYGFREGTSSFSWAMDTTAFLRVAFLGRVIGPH